MIKDRAENGAAIDLTRDAMALAITVLFQRLTTLSKADLEDMYELARELPNANSAEEIQEIRVSMLEILDQKPLRFQEFDLREARTTEKAEQWKKYAGAQIKKLREECGLTQAQLAEKSGLPQSHISRLENAQHSPSSQTIEKIAAALDVKPSQIDPSHDA